MYYRRKIVLALLEVLGGELTKTDFQKHLFLFTRNQVTPAYDFVPYQYGCFSFGADADRAPMVQAGLLYDGKTWKKKTKASYVAALKPDDRRRIKQHVVRYGRLRGVDLVREVYTSHPYYAVYSKIAEDVLNKEEIERVAAAYPPAHEPALFSIGYEGQSLEAFLNKLIKRRVEVLCDIRKNAVSMKFGFSRNTLRRAVEKLGMHYVHIPELGIESGSRKALDSPEAYARLFDHYDRDILPQREEELVRIHRLVLEHERVALTCFEARHTDCHRSRVAEALQRMPQWTYPVIHM